MRLFTCLTLIALFTSALRLTAQQTHEVTVQSNSFSPQELTIAVGDRVTWNNIGGTHNVNGTTATNPENPEGFGSGVAAAAPWSYSFTFTQAGTYAYQCDPHVSFGMAGSIIVEESVATDLLLTGVFDGPLTGGTPKGVELYVLNDIADLSEYGIGSANNGGGSAGVEYTFPAVSATAGSYLYLTSTGVEFAAFFGFDADFVDDASNSSVSINGDDAIELFRNATVVDVFGEIDVDGTGQPWEYLDGWAYRVDGTGPDGNTFVPANWIYGGVNALENGMTNSTVDTPFPAGTYDPSGSGVLTANNDVATTEANTAVTIDVLGNDFLPAPLESLVITMNPGDGTAEVTMDNSITYTPDQDFCGMDALTYEVCVGGACQSATVNITINCPVFYPEYSIGTVTTTNADGAADSLEVTCQLRGVVYGVNLRPEGLQFTIIDGNNDGIGVFNNIGNLGYTVQEGDEIVVQGEVDQFNGLIQLLAARVDLASSGNALVNPDVTNALGEATESQLVRLENVSLVDPAMWSPGGSGFTVQVTDGANTFDVRIDNDVDLFNLPAPTGTFSVTGIGGQFDSSSPYDEGYQLLPRYMEDIDPYSDVLDPSLGKDIAFFPNPVQARLQVLSSDPLDAVRIHSLNGQLVAEWKQPGVVASLDVAKLEAGAYVITFVQGNRIWAQELVKQ
ncbi:MAG: T9SS type A sorting domain-containing protein [Lewinellaceae bacterium]|nr:T9SS type A sorting domain-containing protein [Phaeodactylibacter sp.]MCB9349015.1 T9SS type A sorting domain-containing protein [Lewinellaceae bacterium]